MKTVSQVLGKQLPPAVAAFLIDLAFRIMDADACPLETAAEIDLNAFKATYVYMSNAATRDESAAGDFSAVDAAIMQFANEIAAYYCQAPKALRDQARKCTAREAA